jgi:hypothetical protein
VALPDARAEGFKAVREGSPTWDERCGRADRAPAAATPPVAEPSEEELLAVARPVAPGLEPGQIVITEGETVAFVDHRLAR